MRRRHCSHDPRGRGGAQWGWVRGYLISTVGTGKVLHKNIRYCLLYPNFVSPYTFFTFIIRLGPFEPEKSEQQFPTLLRASLRPHHHVSHYYSRCDMLTVPLPEHLTVSRLYPLLSPWLQWWWDYPPVLSRYYLDNIQIICTDLDIETLELSPCLLYGESCFLLPDASHILIFDGRRGTPGCCCCCCCCCTLHCHRAAGETQIDM